MLGMEKLENAQHTADSMPSDINTIRTADILPLVQERALHNPDEIEALKKMLNPRSNARAKDQRRAKVVLAATNIFVRNCSQLSIQLGSEYNPVSVRAWLLRYIIGGVEGLTKDAHAGGAPSILDNPVGIVAVEMLLCFKPNFIATAYCNGGENGELVLPPDLYIELAGRIQWTQELLAKFLGVAASTVSKFVHKHHIGYFATSKDKDQYCLSNDPHMLGKTLLIHLLRLYGELLGIDLWSFDEMTCIQAIRRVMAMDASGKLKDVDRYERMGVCDMLAIMQPSTGQVVADFYDHKTQKDVNDFLRKFLSERYPAKEGRKVVILMDNLSAHAAVSELQAQFPNLIIVFTPTNASWMNPIESFFQTLSVAMIENVSYDSVETMQKQMLDFIAGYNLRAEPVKWDFAVERYFNQLLLKKAYLKQVYPHFETVRQLGQEVLSGTCLAVGELANNMANSHDVYEYEGTDDTDGVVLIKADVVEEINALFQDQPHGIEAFHASVDVQRQKAGLDDCDKQLFSDEVIQALNDPAAAEKLIYKLLRLLPDKPYRKPPEPKLNQEVINKKEALVAQLESAEKSKIELEAHWDKQVADLEAKQSAPSSNQASDPNLAKAIACRDKVKRDRLKTQARLARERDMLSKQKDAFSQKSTATKDLYEASVNRLLNSLVQAINLWCEYRNQYRADYPRSKPKLKPTNPTSEVA